VEDLDRLLGSISVSCHYNNLRITGENVNVHWNEAENSFKMSGTYGI
jgi:hypothetical protein